MLDVHIGGCVSLHADRAETVGRILRKRCGGANSDEEHVSRTRDRFHRPLEPLVIDGSHAFGDRMRRGSEHF